MAISMAIMIILGLIFNKVFEKLGFPGLLGMLILGVLMGPHALNYMSDDMLLISSDLRKIALIVILLRAGLGIKRDTLNKVGKAAFKMSFIPGLFEGFTVLFVSHKLLGLSFIEAGILGFIIAAVSPAVVVPSMLKLMENKKGEKKGIPTLILAGASIDDVIAITLFSVFLGLYGGGDVNIFKELLNIPISIFLGILLGGLLAFVLLYVFKNYHIRDTKKVLIILGVAILFTGLETYLNEKFSIHAASLLGIMTMGFLFLEKYPPLAKRLSTKFNKIWVFAEILLFVLVGSQVNVSVALDSGMIGLVIIATGLIARSIGVYISLMGTDLNFKEKLFCIISYTPKATVQAAIGAVPLASGVASGELILALAVLSIVVTAPLGAIGIKLSGEAFLN